MSQGSFREADIQGVLGEWRIYCMAQPFYKMWAELGKWRYGRRKSWDQRINNYSYQSPAISEPIRTYRETWRAKHIQHSKWYCKGIFFENIRETFPMCSCTSVAPPASISYRVWDPDNHQGHQSQRWAGGMAKKYVGNLGQLVTSLPAHYSRWPMNLCK